MPIFKPSLSQFLEEEKIRFPTITDGVAQTIQAMAIAAQGILHTFSTNIHQEAAEMAETFNATGDIQQNEDLIAQNWIIDMLEQTQEVCAVVSEELEDVFPLKATTGNYIVALDPLDGSSNCLVNGPIGSLFSIYPRVTSPQRPLHNTDVLLLGKQQLAAGYILYGLHTILVYATIYGVHGFTYDPKLETFFLTHPYIRLPDHGTLYAINHSYLPNCPYYVKNYLAYCQAQEYSSRYTGALISDFHRHLLQGGIYLYPPTLKKPNGKLRLMFECNVLAFIAEQAGGMAVDGTQDILSIKPRYLHQCVPLYIGSKKMVQKLLSSM